jgi:hypothetical protein
MKVEMIPKKRLANPKPETTIPVIRPLFVSKYCHAI